MSLDVHELYRQLVGTGTLDQIVGEAVEQAVRTRASLPPSRDEIALRFAAAIAPTRFRLSERGDALTDSGEVMVGAYRLADAFLAFDRTTKEGARPTSETEEDVRTLALLDGLASKSCACKLHIICNACVAKAGAKRLRQLVRLDALVALGKGEKKP